MRKLILLPFAVLAALALAACGGSGHQSGVLGSDVAKIDQDIAYLQKVEPLPKLRDSGALKNVEYNYTAEADPNKIWYLVTQGMNGNATGYYTIRGPVVDQAAQTTNPQQISCVYYHSNGHCTTVDLGEPDGVYQSGSEQGEYEAVLTDGALIRWAGFYTVSDQPFKLVQTPSLQINENAQISATDTSKTENGIVPRRR